MASCYPPSPRRSRLTAASWLGLVLAIVAGGLAVACADDESESVCSDPNRDYSMIYLTAVRDGDTVSLTQSLSCTIPCECDPAHNCGWEVEGLPAAVGVHSGFPTRCATCEPGGWHNDFDDKGTIEITRIDEDGVAGCVVDTCYKAAKFEATWCPD